MKNLRSIEQVGDLENKNVFLRLDIDVPLAMENGTLRVADDNRLHTSFKTIEYLVKKKAKIIVAGYIDRPEGKIDVAKSTKPVADYLNSFFPQTLHVDDSSGDTVQKAVSFLKKGQILVLENLRFKKEEMENGDDLAREYATFSDVYVNDAFANCHRKEASLVAITKFLPAYAGFHLQSEVQTLSNVLQNPKHPFFVIIGGVKIEDKLPAVKNFLGLADKILVGGQTGCHGEILSKLGNKVSFACGVPDLSFNQAKEWAVQILEAKTIVWNGPMGNISNGQRVGTELIAQAVVEATKKGALSIVGGGDTEAFLKDLRLNQEISFISTGGGAMLSFLSGQTLPALEPLIIG